MTFTLQVFFTNSNFWTTSHDRAGEGGGIFYSLPSLFTLTLRRWAHLSHKLQILTEQAAQVLLVGCVDTVPAETQNRCHCSKPGLLCSKHKIVPLWSDTWHCLFLSVVGALIIHIYGIQYDHLITNQYVMIISGQLHFYLPKFSLSLWSIQTPLFQFFIYYIINCYEF